MSNETYQGFRDTVNKDLEVLNVSAEIHGILLVNIEHV